MENTYGNRETAQMGEVEHKVRLGAGAAAAAAGIWAPLSYKWKGVLTGVAAAALLTGIFGYCPVKRMIESA